MLINEKSRARSVRRRRSVLVMLFSMLPLLVVAGMLAPGFIKVIAVQDDSADASSLRISRRLSRFSRQPLLFPRDFSAGFIPELLDLGHLFSRLDYIKAPSSHDRARLPNFPHSYGDVIVLDDVDQRLREIVFKDPVLMAKSSARTMPPPATDITPLGGHDPVGAGPRFDDFLGPDFDIEDKVVVPEPSTGLLVGLGLLLLTFVGRERAL